MRGWLWRDVGTQHLKLGMELLKRMLRKYRHRSWRQICKIWSSKSRQRVGLLNIVNHMPQGEPLDAVRKFLMPLKCSFTKRKRHLPDYGSMRN